MRALSRGWDALVLGLAALSGAALVFVILAIALDVVLRNLGLMPLVWVSAVVEYVLLGVTVGASPWLVRQGGHVTITSLTDALPEGARRALGRAMLALSAAVLLLLAWRSAAVGLEEWEAGAQDIRSIVIPGWLAYAMLSAGFALIAVEFLRLLAGGAWRAGREASH